MSLLNKSVLFIDVNFDDFFEDYSDKPDRYGGGQILSSAMLSKFDNFHIYANPKSFDNVKPEKQPQCHPLNWEQRKALRSCVPVVDIIPEAKDFDIIYSQATDIHLNLKGLVAKQATWSIGWRETIHPYNKNILLFNPEYQQPIFQTNSHKIHKVVIGKPVPSFEIREKEDFILQISRHTSFFQSAIVANMCRRNGIKAVFGGPVDESYQEAFFNEIDNKYTSYLGIVPYEKKLELAAKSICGTLLHSPVFPTPFTLGGLENLAFGGFLIVTPVGFWPTFIKNGENGFIVNSEDEFLKAWDKRKDMDQEKIYSSVLPYTTEKMIESFVNAFNNLI